MMCAGPHIAEIRYRLRFGGLGYKKRGGKGEKRNRGRKNAMSEDHRAFLHN